MKTFFIILTLFTGFSVYTLSAQCNNKLVEVAASMSGPETVVLREFKIKLDEGTMNKPNPIGRYAILLNEGIHYRFTLANADTIEGRGVLQLYDKIMMLGSTYKTESGEDLKQFDFICKKTKTYQVLLFFRESKSGCMAAVLSMVIPDSARIPGQNGEPEKDVLYIGIDNPMSISTTQPEYTTLKVKISQGTIEGNSGEYIARVSNEGPAVIHVDVFNVNGERIETDSMQFEVKTIPLPQLLIAGKHDGTLYRYELMNVTSIELLVPGVFTGDYYRLAEYTLSMDKSGVNGERVSGNQLLPWLREKIVNMPAGTLFYLTNAVVRNPDGLTFTLPTQTFWLEY
jgi:hypothetical protein